MANRSDRGLGHLALRPGQISPLSRMGPNPRKPSRSAVMCTAQTGRTQDRTRPPRQHFKSFLATREPSTQDVVRPKADIGGIAIYTAKSPAKGKCPGGTKTDLSGLRPISHCLERIFIRYRPSRVCAHHWRLESISYAGCFYNSGPA
jgi:hypothetical protein